MGDCCNDKACELDALRGRQSSMLKWVLGINAIMFIVELTAGLMSGSLSLLADSLDMLGDALVYGFSIYVVARGARMKARVALFKGIIMAMFALFVLGEAIYRMLFPHVPGFETIGAIGFFALSANRICFFLPLRHPSPDIQMSSVWLCSRNDIIANVSVLFAAAGVWLTHSGWPDILVGLALAALFARSALFVLRGAITELRAINT